MGLCMDGCGRTVNCPHAASHRSHRALPAPSWHFIRLDPFALSRPGSDPFAVQLRAVLAAPRFPATASFVAG